MILDENEWSKNGQGGGTLKFICSAQIANNEAWGNLNEIFLSSKETHF